MVNYIQIITSRQAKYEINMVHDTHIYEKQQIKLFSSKFFLIDQLN